MKNKEIKKTNYSIEDKKEDINKLKECAKYYKDNLLGKRFLIVFNNGEYIETIFTTKEFKHLTGVSSNLKSKDFYKLCIGKKTQNKRIQYISPNDIYTTHEHPRIFALKKFRVFKNIFNLFSECSYILKNISENKKFYKIGIANFELTLFENDDLYGNIYSPVSLKSESHLINAETYNKIEYVFVKNNPYLKYTKLIYPKTIDENSYLYNGKYNELIDFENITK